MHFEREGEPFSEKEEKIPAASIFSLGTPFEEKTAAREGMKIKERTAAFIAGLYSSYGTVSVQHARFSSIIIVIFLGTDFEVCIDSLYGLSVQSV